MQNTVEWINLLPGVKAASTELAVKRHTFISHAALCQVLWSPCALRMIARFSFSTSSVEQGSSNQLMSLCAASSLPWLKKMEKNPQMTIFPITLKEEVQRSWKKMVLFLLKKVFLCWGAYMITHLSNTLFFSVLSAERREMVKACVTSFQLAIFTLTRRILTHALSPASHTSFAKEDARLALKSCG